MSTHSVIGIDLGGTKIALARYSETWNLEDSFKTDTNAEQNFAAVFAEMVMHCKKMITPNTKAIGIGVPGLVTASDGSIVTLPNIPGAEGFALKDRLEKEVHLPVFVDNDVHCFALAEALQGAGKDHSVVIGITMGTGVGGGIVVDGKIFHGSHGYAAEIGHMLLRPGEPPFATADKRGDVEQFFSGTALGKRCAEAKDPADYLKGEACAYLHPDIAKEIAWMCTNLIHVVDPSIIIFGGSAGRALAPHLPEVLKELKQWTLPGTPLPELKIATLKDAGTRGAAMLVR
jgi:glucokinase